MKYRNKVKRLLARQKDYADMMSGKNGHKAPDCPDGYHKPGSLKQN
jgi:hypothetical protein